MGRSDMYSLKDRYKFDLPSEWEDQTVYHFRGPRIGSVEHIMRLAVDRNLQYTEIKSFAREKSDPIKNQMSDIEVLKDKETTIDGGNPVWEFVYKWVPSDDMVSIHKYIFVISEKIGFTFSCEFTKKSFKMLGDHVKEVVESAVPGTYRPIEED